MARQGISTGTIPNDGTGDTLLSGAIKINQNFSEVYGLIGDGTNAYVGIVTQIVAGSNISISTSYGSVTVTSTASGGGESYWTQTDVGIHTLSNVGIGTTNSTSRLTVGGDAKVSGAVTATSFVGDGSGLTNIPAGQLTGILPVLDGSNLFGVTASGTGIIVKDDGSTVGTAGTIDFGSNLSVTFASGIATVTASGGGGESYWTQTDVGIHTLSNVGIGTTNPTSALTVKGNTSLETLNVSGVSTFKGSIYGDTVITDGSIYSLTGFTTFGINVARGVDFLHQGALGKVRISGDGVYGNGRLAFYNGSNNEVAVWDSNLGSGSIDIYNYTNSGTQNITISAGSSVVLQHGGTNTKLQTLGAGVTVTGTTFTNQLSVSGVSTFVGIVTTQSDLFVGGTLYAPSLSITGGVVATGVITASSFSGSNTLKERSIVTGVTTSIANNGIGNTDISGFKSYALLKVGISTAGWLRLYTDSASRDADVVRSVGEDPTPGSGVIAEVVTTGISTTQIISPFVIGGNLDDPADTTIYASIKNLSGSTQAITANLTILQLEA